VRTPCVPTKQAQKYSPLLRKYENHSRTLSSTQMYQAAPTKAAIVMVTGKSFFRSSATLMLGIRRQQDDVEKSQERVDKPRTTREKWRRSRN
jgi:ribosomal protein S30